MSTLATDNIAKINNIVAQRRTSRWKDALISNIVFLNGILAIIVIILIFVFLIKDSLPLLKHVNLREFLAGKLWQPEFEKFGIVPLIAGSFVVTVGALLVAVPIGIASAIYIAEIAPRWVREILKPTIEILAGIPSVVVGFIGMAIVAPLMIRLFNLPTGLTAITASVMLAFMAIPTIISISEDAITAVPKSYRDGSLALGANKWETIKGVVVPSARSGIIAACMLGVGRAVGETMTVLMVAGNAANVPEGILGLGRFFLGPVRTMTATIAADMGETVQYSSHYHALFGVGLTLFLITFLINFLADLALRRDRQHG